MTYLRTIDLRHTCAWALLVVVGCVVNDPNGKETTASDTSDGGSASQTDDGSSGSGSTTGGEPILCPDNPGACPSSECDASAGCGGVFSEFDEDGCHRQRCSDETPCPDGRVCLAVGPWGECAPSTSICEYEEAEGQCACGGTADCSPEVSFCIPAELAPPPVERCRPPAGEIDEEPAIDDPAFTFAPQISAEAVGSSNCTVASVASGGSELELVCTGALTGTYALTLAAPSTPIVTQDSLTLQYHRSEENGAPEEWLRILRNDETPALLVVAVQAGALLPAGVSEGFWHGDLEVQVGDIGCPAQRCSGGDDTTQGHTIRVAVGAESLDFAPGEAGAVPGDEGTFITVIEARDRCSPEAGGVPGTRYAFTLVQPGE